MAVYRRRNDRPDDVFFQEQRLPATALALYHRLCQHAMRHYTRGDKAEAEDLVQDTYERAVRFYARFEEGKSIEAWLFSILRHVFLNAWRKQNVRMRPLPIIRDRLRQDDIEWGGFESYDCFVERALTEPMRTAFLTLSKGQRHALFLCDIQDMSYADAARMCGVPAGTIMSRLCRGRRDMRAILTGQVAQKKRRARKALHSVPT